MEFLAQQAQPVEQQPASANPGGTAPGGCGADPTTLILLLLVWGIFYFVVMRPQSKAEKARKAKLAAIQKGDLVRTRGGIIAPVVRVKDAEVVLRLESDTKVEILVAKSYIDEVLKGDDAEKPSDTEKKA